LPFARNLPIQRYTLIWLELFDLKGLNIASIRCHSGWQKQRSFRVGNLLITDIFDHKTNVSRFAHFDKRLCRTEFFQLQFWAHHCDLNTVYQKFASGSLSCGLVYTRSKVDLLRIPSGSEIKLYRCKVPLSIAYVSRRHCIDLSSYFPLTRLIHSDDADLQVSAIHLGRYSFVPKSSNAANERHQRIVVAIDSNNSIRYALHK
jgi:hypothetical protein